MRQINPFSSSVWSSNMATTVTVSLFSLFGTVLGGDPRLVQETLLRERLFKDYNDEVRPSEVETIVTFSGMSLKYINYDDRSSIFSMYGWMTLDWFDERLVWNASEFQDVGGSISVPLGKLWKPDLSVMNSATPEDLWVAKDIPVLVTAEGNVLSLLPMRFRVPCVADLTLWPRDVQICYVSFGCWTHHGQQVNLMLAEVVEVKTDELPSRTLADGSTIFTTEWNLLKTAVKKNVNHYACCPEPYVDIQILAIIQRNTPAYEALIHVPAVCLSFLTLVLFLLPPTAGEKMTFGGICLILNLFLTAFTFSVIGQSPSRTPLIVELLSSQLKFLVLGVFTSAFMIRIGSGPHSCRLPGFFVKILTALSCILCLCSYKDEEREENLEGNFPPTETPAPLSAANTSKAVAEASPIYPNLAEKPSPSDIELHPIQPRPYPSVSRYPIGEVLPAISEALPEYDYRPASPLDEDTSEAIGSLQEISFSRPAPSIRCKAKHPRGRDWLLLAATIDRLALLVYFFTCSVSLARYYLAPLLKFDEMLPELR